MRRHRIRDRRPGLRWAILIIAVLLLAGVGAAASGSQRLVTILGWAVMLLPLVLILVGLFGSLVCSYRAAHGGRLGGRGHSRRWHRKAFEDRCPVGFSGGRFRGGRSPNSLGSSGYGGLD